MLWQEQRMGHFTRTAQCVERRSETQRWRTSATDRCEPGLYANSIGTARVRDTRGIILLCSLRPKDDVAKGTHIRGRNERFPGDTNVVV